MSKSRCIFKGFGILIGALIVYETIVIVLTTLTSNDSKISHYNTARTDFDYFYVEELLLDTRKEPSKEKILDYIEEELPALPFKFIDYNQNGFFKFNKTCAPYPNIRDIEFQNDYWQIYRNTNLTYQLYGAYYDKRQSVPEKSVIRVLAMINQIGEKYPQSYCQFWFKENTTPTIVSVVNHTAIWYTAWGTRVRNHMFPHLLSCVVPEEIQNETWIPKTVSLVAQECDRATNSLKVIYEEQPKNETKKGFVVCVKSLNSPYVDMSARLVEWLELMRILGAEKVFIYTFKLHPNITKIFDYYESKGFVRVVPFTYPHGEPSLKNLRHAAFSRASQEKRLNELIPYNDCLYRNIYEYNYLAAVDIDEVIMPLGNLTTWHDIVRVGEAIRHDECTKFASFCFLNTYFPHYTDLGPYSALAPDYLYMLQHVYRIEKHLNSRTASKCLHNTKYVVALHNHFTLKFVGSCRPQSINTSMAHLQHYRAPDNGHTMADKRIKDANIWRFEETLVKRVREVFSNLGFYKMRKVQFKGVGFK